MQSERSMSKQRTAGMSVNRATTVNFMFGFNSCITKRFKAEFDLNLPTVQNVILGKVLNVTERNSA